MHTAQHQVRNWHSRMGYDFPWPGAAPVDITRSQKLRIDLIAEEFNELKDALANDNIIDTADAIADLLFVIYGACDTWGIDIAPVFEEVVRSNNTKVGGPVREDGKLLKPDTYEPPDIATALCTTHGCRNTGCNGHLTFYDGR